MRRVLAALLLALAGAAPARAHAPAPHVDVARYQGAVAMFAGSASRPWPGEPTRTARFTDRLLGHPGNQLNEVVAYLEAYYAMLGIRTARQPFSFRGQTYYNLAATIPGRSPETVVLADHFDAAATADYDKALLGREAPQYGLPAPRIGAIARQHRAGAPVPGADDNASATAALLEAAHQWRGAQPAKTLVLLHLNGEEFPGDDLGARAWAAAAMRAGTPVVGVVVMDMIGVNRQRDHVFQVALGKHPASAELARFAEAAARPGFRPRRRGFGDPASYLYNTDAMIFSAAGYPTIMLNEHLHHDRDLYRLGYHDEFDRPELFDWPYAAAVAQAGIDAAARLAHEPGLRWPAVRARLASLRAPRARASHFHVELLESTLYNRVGLLARQLRREPTRAELLPLIADDRANRDPDAVTKRMTTWFPESGLVAIDHGAIADEILGLRARSRKVKMNLTSP